MIDHSIRGKVALIAGGAKNLGGLIAQMPAQILQASVHGFEDISSSAAIHSE